MTALNVKVLPIEEKIRLMEAIWEDMREQFEKSSFPPDILALLQERQERIRSGESKLLDWNRVKATLGRP